MLLDIIKTPTRGTAWSLEIREPLLVDHTGPGYRVILKAEYASRERMDNSAHEIRAAYYGRRRPLPHGDCICC